MARGPLWAEFSEKLEDFKNAEKNARVLLLQGQRCAFFALKLAVPQTLTFTAPSIQERRLMDLFCNAALDTKMRYCARVRVSVVRCVQILGMTHLGDPAPWGRGFCSSGEGDFVLHFKTLLVQGLIFPRLTKFF